MKTIRLKYPCTIAGKLIPKGTVLETLDVLDERVQRVWPGVQTKVDSNAITVQFPHLEFPTFVRKDQVED